MFARRFVALPALVATLIGGLLVVSPAPIVTAEAAFPEMLALPDGFRPEGIATGAGTTFYVGSIPTGAVYRGDYRTGLGAVLVPPQPGRSSIGLKADAGTLFVAGGGTGKAFLYDAASGSDVATYQLADGPTFVNDVALTRAAAYFTDSVNPVLYRVARGPAGAPAELTTLPFSGDLVYQPGFNVNGITATPDGTRLIVVQSNTGRVFTVDAATGQTTAIDLAGATVPNGDGVLLSGRILYVVQNRLNLVARIELSADFATGAVVDRIGHAGFDVPTTLAAFGSALYAVNARFGHPSPDTASYTALRLATP